MTYKKALKLKELGFSQISYKPWDLFYVKGGWAVGTLEQMSELREENGMMLHYSEFTRIPTTEQLIGELGNNLYLMKRITIMSSTRNEIRDGWEVIQSVDVDKKPLIFFDENLDNALADLWIAINRFAK